MKPYVKIFSVVFCLLILVGALPLTASAYAEDSEFVCEISNTATNDEATYEEATYDEATYDEATYDELCYVSTDKLYCTAKSYGGAAYPESANSSGSANDIGFTDVTTTDKLHVASVTEKAKPKEAKTTDTLIYDEKMPKSGNGDTKTLKVQSTPVFGNIFLWIISGSALCILGAGTVCFVLIKRKRFNR